MTRRQFGTVRLLASGHWQARYSHLGRRHEADRTFATLGDANAFLADQESAIRRGAWIDPRAGKVLLGSYAAEWLRTRTDLAQGTRSLYEDLLAIHILPGLGDYALAAITPAQVRSWRVGLPATIVARERQRAEAVARARNREPVVRPFTGESTAAKAYRLLSEIMASAISDEMIVRNPCRVKRGGKEPKGRGEIITVAEIEALCLAMPEHMRAAVLLGAWCQLRRAELLGLRRHAVNLLDGSVGVESTRTWVGGPVEKDPKSEAGARRLTIPPHVIPPLREHLERHVGPEPDAYVFVGARDGRPLSPSVLYKHWDRARRSIGRPKLRPHDLRHTGLTLTAAMGATLAELMYRAGHSSPAAALAYQHATKDRDRTLAEALSTLHKPATVTPIGHGQGTATGLYGAT